MESATYTPDLLKNVAAARDFEKALHWPAGNPGPPPCPRMSTGQPRKRTCLIPVRSKQTNHKESIIDEQRSHMKVGPGSREVNALTVSMLLSISQRGTIMARKVKVWTLVTYVSPLGTS